MWVSYKHKNYWIMCEHFHGKYKHYHIKYFPFLKNKVTISMFFLGYSIPRSFVNFTPEELQALRVYDIIDDISNN